MGSLDSEISIPLIDISPFLSVTSDQTSRDSVVSAIRSACEDYGFFQLTGHGVPISLQREMLLCAQRLFALPVEDKHAMAMSKSMGMAKRGYEAIGGQKLDVKPDTKEGFYVGFEMDESHPEAGSFLKGPNFWPKSLSDEEFRIPVMEYHKQVLKLHELLLKVLAMGMGYGEDIFSRLGFMENPVANLKLLHYPPNPPRNSEEERSLGAGAHTDFGATTILLQQPNQHGLQVLYPLTNTWISVPAIEDLFIFNVGDLLDKWTAGKYRSAVHRVVNISTTDRYSVPLFYQGNLSTRLNPLSGDEGCGETVEEHIKSMFKKTFGS